MNILSFLRLGLLWYVVSLSPALLWAAPPNVVLSRALHFSSPDGTPITIEPGKYFIEQAGPSKMRVIPEGDKPGLTIQAESLTHEQYELFSPMALTRPQKNEEVLIELLLPGGIRLEARGSTKAPVESPKIALVSPPPPSPLTPMPEAAASVPPPVPTSPPSMQEDTPATLALPTGDSSAMTKSLDTFLPYHAPQVSAQGTRVVVDEQEPGKDPLYLSVLSPDHVGLTMFEQPALFWFIAQLTSQPVDVMIMDEGNTQILLDVRMLPPIQPGIHKVDLKDYGIRLQLNTTYQWRIVLQGLNPGESHTTNGWIMRVLPSANVATLANLPSINATPTEPLLEAGLWYDAIWALSERLHTDPNDVRALTQRANLFEQVGLLPPARQDRAHLPLP
ncbi:MAG: DUF928 domain-containing protein [Nitrospirales bacterium]|nr:DUF928 domain-containing protein [Nitrospirales bacterium]